MSFLKSGKIFYTGEQRNSPTGLDRQLDGRPRKKITVAYIKSF